MVCIVSVLAFQTFRSPWHQYEIWKRAREKHPELGSTGAELKTLYECNREYLARLDFDLENGKLGLRRAFNRVVFNALSNAFNETNEKLQGKFEELFSYIFEKKDRF